MVSVFNYSLDGLLADEGTEFWRFCFGLPENREPADPAQLDFLQSAYAHIMGRTAYEAIAGSMTTSTDHPFAGILNAARKVVFSRTLKTADWASATIAAGDTAEEIDKLRQGGNGHIVVWGGVSLWRSLLRLDLIDELQLSLFPEPLTSSGRYMRRNGSFVCRHPPMSSACASVGQPSPEAQIIKFFAHRRCRYVPAQRPGP